MIEEIIDSFEYIIVLKEKNIKTWEDIFPSFYRIAKNNIKEIKEHGLLDDIKKLLTYAKALEKFDETNRNKIFDNLKQYIVSLKEKFLVDEIIVPPEKKLSLFTDIKYVKNVGPKRAALLNKMGIECLNDFFYFPPRDYEDRRKVTKIFNAKDGEKVVIIGKIVNYEEVKINKDLTILNYSVEDDTGIIRITFFNQIYIKNYLSKGTIAAFYGKIEYTYGVKQMKSPDFQVLNTQDDFQKEILPVYPLTAGLTQNIIRNISREVVNQTFFLEEFLPNDFIEEFNLLTLKKRLKGLHFPLSFYHKNRALYSLKYEEAILFELAIIYVKLKLKENKKTEGKQIKGELSNKFIDMLNFELTDAQKRCYEEIKNDLTSYYPMNRLLQGDVGSGKTVVSELAVIDVCEAGYQSAIMVPTSVLAKQQFNRISKDFEPLGLKTELLIGETKENDKIAIKERLKNGEIDVIIGTHAIIQEDVEFKKLGFVVIDEQQRFGVNQRLQLIKKGNQPDILVMTATPIPRTLAMTFYGDMDVSVLDEMPKGRKPIKTFLVPDSKMNSVYRFVKQELDQNNQIFFIYPLVEESETLDLKNATEMYEKLAHVFNDYKVGLLHGKLPSSEKNEIMDKFMKKEYNILVATSVVEVGIDVPDATVMVIEHPDRFGLSQLHQLRGRVGRGKKQSYCFLIIDKKINRETRQKLSAFSKTNDGFKVAEIDLQWRGPGKFFGVEQHGIPEFKFLDLIEDFSIISQSRKKVEQFLVNPDDLKNLERLKSELKIRYGNSIELIHVL